MYIQFPPNFMSTVWWHSGLKKIKKSTRNSTYLFFPLQIVDFILWSKQCGFPKWHFFWGMLAQKFDYAMLRHINCIFDLLVSFKMLMHWGDERKKLHWNLLAALKWWCDLIFWFFPWCALKQHLLMQQQCNMEIENIKHSGEKNQRQLFLHFKRIL